MDLLAHIFAAQDSGPDNSLKFWFWLIVGIIFVIKTVIGSLKAKKEAGEEEPVLETEDHHEKRVREVIAEMRRTTPPQPQAAPRPEAVHPRIPARSSRPAPVPVELPNPSVKHRRRPAPEPAPGWGRTQGAQEAAKNTLASYVKATEEAHQSIQSLSDAEQAALQRLQHQEAARLPEAVASAPLSQSLSLKGSLRTSQSLRTAILYQEILGKPKALQGFQ